MQKGKGAEIKVSCFSLHLACFDNWSTFSQSLVVWSAGRWNTGNNKLMRTSGKKKPVSSMKFWKRFDKKEKKKKEKSTTLQRRKWRFPWSVLSVFCSAVMNIFVPNLRRPRREMELWGIKGGKLRFCFAWLQLVDSRLLSQPFSGKWGLGIERDRNGVFI